MGAAEADRLFSPESVTWRVNREAALLLGGGRALLMQLAHPGVAAGVDEHSDFRSRPVGRLLRTLELTLALSFGSRESALRAAQAINRTHLKVRGPGYTARDPDLLLWVHATLIDSALVSYAAFVGRLADPEREAYYQEAQRVGALLGIPPAAYPAGLAGFRAYLEGMLAASGPLRVDARARSLAAAVLRPPLRLPGAAFAPTAVITAGLLPESLRLAYGLRWRPIERALFAIASRAGPPAAAVTPRRLRWLPAAAGDRLIE